MHKKVSGAVKLYGALLGVVLGVTNRHKRHTRVQ
jgi:hypothetical protein